MARGESIALNGSVLLLWPGSAEQLLLHLVGPLNRLVSPFSGFTNQPEISCRRLWLPGFAHNCQCIGESRLSFMLVLSQHGQFEQRRMVLTVWLPR
jgi:hypothetical protein